MGFGVHAVRASSSGSWSPETSGAVARAELRARRVDVEPRHVLADEIEALLGQSDEHLDGHGRHCRQHPAHPAVAVGASQTQQGALVVEPLVDGDGARSDG
jgi:hypothetical protein